MMDNTMVEERNNDSPSLISAVPVEMVSTEEHGETITKMTPVPVSSSSVQQELMTTQYIQLHRVPDQLHKVLVTDALSSDLLTHHVELTTSADFTQHGVTAQYYDTDDLLTPELTEEDRRLAAELVAAQLKHPQHHQTNQILSSTVTPLPGVQTIEIDKPSTISTAIVTGYIQTVEDDVHHQLLEQQDGDRCIMKIYQHSSSNPEMQVLSRQVSNSQPLPPLKKVLSSQSASLRNKFAPTSAVIVDVPTTSIMTTRCIDDAGVNNKADTICKISQQDLVPTSMQSATTPIVTSAGQALAPLDELDSDYDVENDTRPSRRSLPHKKRIPRKLKAPAARSIHSKCYKCNKCGESFNTQAAFSAHRIVHQASSNSKQRPNVNSSLLTVFNCELCNKQFSAQLKFFEHLKQHYEPARNSDSGDDQSDIASVNIRGKSSLNSSVDNDLQGLTPARIVATCIPPVSEQEKLHSSMVSSQAINNIGLSGGHSQKVIMNHISSPIHSQPTITGTFSIKDELIRQNSISSSLGILQPTKRKNKFSDIVKEEIVTATGLSCAQCGEIFRRTRAFETHIATAHPRHDEIEEFSEPEDMMVDIRHAVDIADGDSADEGHVNDEQCDSNEMVVDSKWKYQDGIQELGMDLQGMCMPLPSASTIQSTRQTSAANVQNNNANHNGIGSQSKGKIEDLMSNNNSGDLDVVSKKKQLNCTECDRTFNHRNSLLYHIRSHSGQRPHQCEVCGKSFFSASALKVHTRLHSGDKPYKCEYCGRNFRQWGDLKYHITSLHSNQKQFQCEYCGKDFARKYSLIVHRRIHTGEKNYRCEYCNKTFRASSYLQNHRRIHTGEKPHSCDICGKPFRVRSDMKRHRRTHNRESRQPSSRSSANIAVPEVIHATEMDDDSTGTETILPDNAMSTPLNLNIRQGDSNEDNLTYTRTNLDRESSTLYVWIPAQDAHLLSDE